MINYPWKKKVREKSRECHNHKPQPFPDPKRKRKPTNPNKHKSNKHTKSTKISSLFPKRGNRNTKRTKKHKNKMTHGKTYNKSPRRINQNSVRIKAPYSVNASKRKHKFEVCLGVWYSCKLLKPLYLAFSFLLSSRRSISALKRNLPMFLL